VAGSGVPTVVGGETGGTMIGGGATGGTITGGGGGGTNGGGATGGVTTIGGGSAGGLTTTGGLTGHTGGKNADAAGDQTAKGIAVSETVTAGSNFLSFFFNRARRAIQTPSVAWTHPTSRIVRLVTISSARPLAPLEHFAP
jgi:hypothetical protein